MKKKIVVLVLCAMLFALCPPAEAQQPKTVPRIGYVGAGSPATAGHHAQAFAQGLRELGYVEGQNIAIEHRWAEGKLESMPGFVVDLIRLKVDVIVSSATPAIRIAKEQSSSVPIVMAGVTDPVGNGFVASLARPGGNITGLTHVAPDLTGKRLELLKEVCSTPLTRSRTMESETTRSGGRLQRERGSGTNAEIDIDLHGGAQPGRD